jgi:hypothetical protein
LVTLVADPLHPTLLGKVGNTGNPEVHALGSVIPFGNGDLDLVLKRNVAGPGVGKPPGSAVDLDGDWPALSPGGTDPQLTTCDTFRDADLDLRVRPDNVSTLLIPGADRILFVYKRSSTVSRSCREEHHRIATNIAKVVPVKGEDLADYERFGSNARDNGKPQGGI